MCDTKNCETCAVAIWKHYGSFHIYYCLLYKTRYQEQLGGWTAGQEPELLDQHVAIGRRRLAHRGGAVCGRPGCSGQKLIGGI